MKCQKVVDRLSALLDDELSDTERAAIAGHVEVCPGCRCELDRLAADRELLLRTSVPEEPPFLAARVFAEVRASKRRSAQGLLRRALVPVAAALLVAVSLGAGTMLGIGLARTRQTADLNELATDADGLTFETYAALAGGE